MKIYMESLPRLGLKLKLISFFVGLIFAFLIPAHFTQAAIGTFGISPATVGGVIRQGDIIEDSFNVSRSDSVGVMKFDSRVEGDIPIIFLSDEIILEDGESAVKVPFVLDTSELAPGVYSGAIVFIPQGQGGGGGVVVIFSVSAQYSFEVLGEDEFYAFVKSSSIEIQHIQKDSYEYAPWDDIGLSVTLLNKSNAYVLDANPLIEIYNQKGFLVGEGSIIGDVVLKPNRTVTFKSSLPGQRAGNYSVTVAIKSNMADIEQGRISIPVVSEPFPLVSILIVLIALLITAATGAVCKIKYDNIKKERKCK